MRVSVVIRSKDEADRLRLALTSLVKQTAPCEVLVVDDGSRDHTPSVLSELSSVIPLRSVRHATPFGRSAAANAGARLATGDVLLFLDGDVLAHRELVARHAATHDSSTMPVVGRGETFHLRCTRFLLDPEVASPRPGEEARLARMTATERDRLRVTRAQITDDFAAIERRAELAIYPGAGPRRLYELECDALREHQDCSVLWAAASGHNLSVRTDAFLRAGGFDEDLDINEHRELCLRLCAAGARMTMVDGARSFHMTHRSGWRDPLQDARWEQVFYRAHPLPAVKLLPLFWATVGGAVVLPPEARIETLVALERAAQGNDGVDYEAARRLVPGVLSP